MNINNLQIKLQELMSSTSTMDMMQLAKAIQLLNIGQVRSVDAYIELPDPLLHMGWLYIVTNDERIYFSDGERWISMTDRVPSTIWGWGYNGQGQLGNCTIVSTSSPVSVVGGFTNWVQVSTGRNHTVALQKDGTIWSWGLNGYGLLGDNTITNRSSPVSVVGGFTDWYQVSAGRLHSLAVRQDGTIWSWGFNGQGRLGDNTVTSRSSPVSVVGGFTDWCQVSAGSDHSLAVRQDGTIWSWGTNGQGRLGDNTTTSRSSPVSVVGGFTDWCQVSTGLSHSLAVRQNGTIWSWGTNGNGRLGDNTTTARSSPVSVVGGFTDWCQVSAGNTHSSALRQNGTIWTWGFNSSGQLGDDTTAAKLSPVSVVGGFTDWCQVSAGGYHSSALRQNGTIWTWGTNAQGRLGDNTITNRSSPVSVVGGFTDWCQVSAGYVSSGAIRLTIV